MLIELKLGNMRALQRQNSPKRLNQKKKQKYVHKWDIIATCDSLTTISTVRYTCHSKLEWNAEEKEKKGIKRKTRPKSGLFQFQMNFCHSIGTCSLRLRTTKRIRRRKKNTKCGAARQRELTNMKAMSTYTCHWRCHNEIHGLHKHLQPSSKTE